MRARRRAGTATAVASPGHGAGALASRPPAARLRRTRLCASAATAGGTTATSGADGTFDSAFVYGDGSTAFSGGTVADPGTFDSAIVIGNVDAGNAGGDMAGAGSYDVSYVEGNDLATANAQGAD